MKIFKNVLEVRGLKIGNIQVPCLKCLTAYTTKIIQSFSISCLIFNCCLAYSRSHLFEITVPFITIKFHNYEEAISEDVENM